jgi:lipoprotein-anchoring transpeptidase ErfK/SrfK
MSVPLSTPTPIGVPAPARVGPATKRWHALARRLPGRGFWITLGAMATLGLGVLLALALYGTAARQRPLATVATVPAAALALEPARTEQLLAAIRSKQPRGVHVVVDTYRNRLRVIDDGEVLRDAVCSTGSGAVVRDPRNGRVWVFDTPIGERTVREKRKNPVWKKPDWAFVEEGFLPPKRADLRYDEFSLGDYGLYMGDGYIIHGTVFQTLLGQAITHGCIRLGDKDLEYVYKTVPLGARVYLF